MTHPSISIFKCGILKDSIAQALFDMKKSDLEFGIMEQFVHDYLKDEEIIVSNTVAM